MLLPLMWKKKGCFSGLDLSDRQFQTSMGTSELISGPNVSIFPFRLLFGIEELVITADEQLKGSSYSL